MSSDTTARKGQKKSSEGPARRPHKANAQSKPSAAILAAKHKARARQMAKKQEDTFFIRDDYQAMFDVKEQFRGPTGVVYDDRMVENRCLWDSNYQECPGRYTKVMERCRELGLLDRCKLIASREAREEEVLSLHKQEHLDKLKATDGCSDIDQLELLSSQYDAIYIHPMTYRLSLLSVGSTIQLVDEILKGNVQNGMAIIRPPGHHAMKSEYCGYCYFNNVALAAEHALNHLGLNRILIVDWDVHHGQATQQMFYSDPRVLYFSIHRYEHGTFWPNLRESDFDYTGDGEGKGFNFNIPLNKIGMANADYLAIFQQVLLPVATEFQPELIIVSAGYDAAVGCPEGEMEVTPACYAHLLSSLSGLASGKIAVILEGGYFLKSLAEGAALTLRTLLGDSCPTIESLQPPSQSITESILNVIYSHRKEWKCFQLQDTYSLKALQQENRLIDERTQHLPFILYDYKEEKPTVYKTRDCYPVRSEETIAHYHDFLKNGSNEPIFSNPYPVYFVYDPLMMEHRNMFDSHPERPERISNIYETLKQYNVLERMNHLPSRKATEEELLLVHSSEHVGQMKSVGSIPLPAEANEKEWRELSKEESYKSIYLHPKSYDSALLAAGSLLQVVDSVMNGESGSGIAVIRPPGHHAEEFEPCGFCIFNNVSVAAKYAITKYNLTRVLILDWDIHHGNGTQHIFEDDPRCLYVSIHRYDNGNFFPNSTDADASVVGSGDGRGYNVNVPWNKGGMTGADYVAAFHHIVLPIAYQYNPQLVLVSAGFDAAIADPLGGCKVLPETYAHLTHWLSSLAGGRVILALEGGYNITSISYAMTACAKSLLGDPLPVLDASNGACRSAITSIKQVIQIQKEFWSCLAFHKSLPEENVLEAGCAGQNEVDGKPENSCQEQNETDDMKLVRLSSVKLHEGSCDDLTDRMQTLTLVTNCGTGDNPMGKEVWPAGGSSSNATPSSSSSTMEESGAAGGANQTLTDYLSDNLELLLSEQMFAVVPLSSCPHLPEVRPVPSTGIDIHAPCSDCTSSNENWTCLICYLVFCGRFVNGHMVQHGDDNRHPLCLSFSDLSVWCYGCEAYVDNPVLFPAKNAAHVSKFGTELTWSYSSPRPVN
ncbi:histone deacetylase 6 [Nilaparvata lugens]|uniref:histone deacetylase 6 n=1 Tax=Nilaparvata lugens TaxID=108931 RepID=UPI00193EAC3B|nr:histone deacetylase 6 [Nilaparvata lugens]